MKPKHPPKTVWVGHCTRCGELAQLAKREIKQPFCPFCRGEPMVKIVRYRLLSAIGAGR